MRFFFLSGAVMGTVERRHGRGTRRHGLGLAAGALISNGSVSSDQLNTTAGAVTAIVVVAWSIFQKRRAAKGL
jgi:hypothetical protein